jgi:enoyl-CoA hydratase/3-hydroxyacyl-CoA dehydrogenase
MANSIKHVTVLGAGDMGHGIAEVALLAGYIVTLRDISEDAVARGLQRIEDSLDVFVRKAKISPAAKSTMMANLHSQVDLKLAVANADLVIEAIPEILKLKISTFQDLSKFTKDSCILASNTSTMSISTIANATTRKDKVAGLHYFNPAVLMPTVEITRSEHTSEDTMTALYEFCNTCKKMPVRVEKDVAGFIVNRAQAPSQVLLNAWVDQNLVDPETVDAMVRTQAGAPMGPYETIDYTGLDVNVSCFNYYADHIHPNYTPGTAISKLAQAGKLGKKTGQGFFNWEQGRPQIDLTKTTTTVAMDDLFLVNANQAVELCEMGVATASDIQSALKGATGNPNGMFENLKKYPRQEVVDRLNTLAEKFDKEIFKPCQGILENAYDNYDVT